MGLFNILETKLKCPRCGFESEMEVEFKIGYLDLQTYRLGDKLTWASGIAKCPHQKRPNNGNFIGEGYVECPNCKKDFWITINIQNDILTKVKLDLTKQGYIP